MSGPVCPDCGSFDTYVEGKKERCRLCNWKGDRLPRKIMSGEMMRSHNQETKRKEALKKKGKFFFIRVYFSREDDDIDEIEDMVYDLLEPDFLTTSYEKPYYFYGETEEEPTQDVLKKLKKIKRVKNITVN